MLFSENDKVHAPVVSQAVSTMMLSSKMEKRPPSVPAIVSLQSSNDISVGRELREKAQEEYELRRTIPYGPIDSPVLQSPIANQTERERDDLARRMLSILENSDNRSAVCSFPETQRPREEAWQQLREHGEVSTTEKIRSPAVHQLLLQS